jgi:hypothetical protein
MNWSSLDEADDGDAVFGEFAGVRTLMLLIYMRLCSRVVEQHAYMTRIFAHTIEN